MIGLDIQNYKLLQVVEGWLQTTTYITPENNNTVNAYIIVYIVCILCAIIIAY